MQHQNGGGAFRGQGYSGASTPTLSQHDGYGNSAYTRLREPYPAWTQESQIPLSKEEIEDVFVDLANKFGFQRDSMRNMYDHLMIQLDSRASRMAPNQALLTLHADYIGGEHANYRKWYFAAQLDLDDAIGSTQNAGPASRLARRATRTKKNATAEPKKLESAANRWRQAMANMSPYDRIRQIALYLLCWGEAAQVRFTPECLCFIFKCADDYYRSPECQNRVEPVPEGLYLRAVVRPLYRFLRDQGYEVQDGIFVRRERDHEQIIGYDDVNQLFWYPEGINRIVLNDRVSAVCLRSGRIWTYIALVSQTRLVDVPPSQRFMKFDKIEWHRAFFKTYYEKRSFMHLLVNFNRIWVLHISLYWYYTAYNAPSIYTLPNQRKPAKATQWTAVALGGAVSTLIMIAATIAEFSYVPTTWNNTSHLARRLVFLIIVLALTAGPSIYILFVAKPTPADDFVGGLQVPVIIGIVQFGLSVLATIMFSVVPSGRMFGDRVSGKARKYLASQTFTAAYPALGSKARAASVALWVLIFACKFTESYFFLTLSFVRSY